MLLGNRQRQRRGGRAFLWLLIGLLIGGSAGAATVYFLKPEKVGAPKGPELVPVHELALVPTDAAGFIHIRARDFWKSELLTDLRSLVDKAGAGALAKLDEGFAPAPSSLDRVTLVFFHDSKPSLFPSTLKILSEIAPVGILTFTEAFDEARVRAALVPAAASKNIAGHAYWVDDARNLAVYFRSSNVLAIGTASGIQQIIAQQTADGKRPEGPLSGPLELAAKGEHHAIAAINARHFDEGAKKLVGEFLGQPLKKEELAKAIGVPEPLLHTDSYAIGLSLKNQDELKVDIRAFFKDEKDAENGETAVRTSLTEFANKKLADSRKKSEESLKGQANQSKPRSLSDLPQAMLSLAEIGALKKAQETLTNPPLTRNGKQLVAAFEVAVQGRRGHAEIPGDGAQAQRRGAVGGQVTAGRVQDLRGDLRPGPLPGGARHRATPVFPEPRPGAALRIGHPPMMAQSEIDDNKREQCSCIVARNAYHGSESTAH